MKLRSHIFTLACMLLAPTILSAQNSLNLFIGGYGPADEDGIKWYTFNQETGEYQYITAVSGIQNPSFQTLSTDGNILYSVSENSADAAQLVSLRIDRNAHSLTRIAAAPTFGDDPCHVWVNNNIAITANYTGLLTDTHTTIPTPRPTCLTLTK
jgi:6-phosphogluconolactonase (cycloisomerase 2 family)